MLIVCTGETSIEVMHDALWSVQRPWHVVTMDALWWEATSEWRVPRSWFTDKLKLIRFVLGRSAICLYSPDGSVGAMSLEAALYALNVPIWQIQHLEEV